MTPEEEAALFRVDLLELGNALLAVGTTIGVLLAVIAGVAIVRAVW